MTERPLRPEDALTILLTLKDRVEYTERWMRFAEHVRMPFKVLVADGGADERVPVMFRERREFPNVNVEYVRYPFDSSYTEYYAKVNDVLTRVTTPFIVIADNDDFFTVQGLYDATRFLLDHPDYVSCGGGRAMFWLAAGQDVTSERPYGRIEYKRGHDAQSIAESTARGRIERQALHRHSTYYDVTRTDHIREQFRVAQRVNFSDIFLLEALQEFMTAIAGKSGKLASFYFARQLNSPGSSGTAHQNAFGDWFGRMLVPTWSEDFTKFVEESAEALAQKDDIPLGQARQFIVASYREFIAPEVMATLLGERTIDVTMPVLTRIVQRLVALPRDNPFRRFAQGVFRRVPFVDYGVIMGKGLLTADGNRIRTDMEPIVQFVTRPPASPTR